MDVATPNKTNHLGETYRRDIDGLRALAVMPIVVFHIHPQWMPGGYVGVDIFYVISGYLITGILWREIENGTFSLVVFYERAGSSHITSPIRYAIGQFNRGPHRYDTARSPQFCRERP